MRSSLVSLLEGSVRPVWGGGSTREPEIGRGNLGWTQERVGGTGAVEGECSAADRVGFLCVQREGKGVQMHLLKLKNKKTNS